MSHAERVRIGSEFECFVAQLYSKMGYNAETKKKMVGKSGVEYEVDVYLERGKKKSIAECKYKNYGGVSIAEVALLILKMDDIDIKEGIIVTNSAMPEPASLVAKHYGVPYIDDEQLKCLAREYNMEMNFRNTSNPIADAVMSVVDLAGEIFKLPQTIIKSG